jgi:hypothetical protein
VLGLLLAGVGCSQTIRKPQLLHPGTAPFQRYNAEQFDPYPPDDLGPSISGGRPIDFGTPRNEVTRARQYRNGERPLNSPGPVPLFGPTTGPPTLVPRPALY